MKNSILFAAAALIFSTLGSGCKTGVNAIEPARPTASRDVILDNRIILDRALARHLEIEYLNQAFTGDLRTIQTNVRNTTGRPIQFQYRYDWFDDEGMQISSPASTWIVRTLEPGEATALTGVAPTPRAADFRFQISEHFPR